MASAGLAEYDHSFVRYSVLGFACLVALTPELGRGAPLESSKSPEPIYIAAGSEFHYWVARVQLPAELLGEAALRALERGGQGPVEPVLLRGSAAEPPAGWQAGAANALQEMSRGAAPFGARDGMGGDCSCKTVLGNTASERVAALYAVRQFEVGSELDGVAMLRLRARVRDGLVAYINGREVARRHIDAGAGPADMARGPHGPEWETFYVPVTPGLLRTGSNTLALEVRPSASALAPVLDLELGAGVAPRLVRGPMLQQITDRSAVVVFDTDLPAVGQVEYGSGDRLDRIAGGIGGLAVHHVVELGDLPSGQSVRYRVLAGADSTEVFSFHPAPPPGDVLRVGVYGDARGGHAVHAQIVESLLTEAPDLVAVTGDMVARGSDEADWQRFFALTAPLLARVGYYPAVGNHDLGVSGDESLRVGEILALWPGPPDRPDWAHWYSFTVGDTHFAMLDSNAYERPEQLAWLDADLAAARARGVRTIFAFTHDGPWSRGPHGGNSYAAEQYVPILRKHDVRILFSGHDHLYQRGRIGELAYVVTGGGGAPLYPVRCAVGGRGCPSDGARVATSDYHYLILTVFPETIELCAKRPDGTPLESCVHYRR